MLNPFLPPFNHQDISQIHQPQFLQDHIQNLLNQHNNSQYTAAQTLLTQRTNQQTYHSNKVYAINTLQTWGLKIGLLQYSKENQITLKCLLQLISQRQKDIAYRLKVKDQLNSINFQKQKYQSLLKQQRNLLQVKQKQLGKVENQLLELKKKIKSIQTQYKKQKADDQKMINMLRSKNQQILHEIKKKQAQITKVKQQMKKNVLSKSVSIPTGNNKSNQSPIHNNNQPQIKNSFQLIQKIQKGWNVNKNENKMKKNMTQKNMVGGGFNNYSESLEQQKMNFIIEKYERQKKTYSDENIQLRSKIYDIRQILLSFAQWIDIQLFGQPLDQIKKFLEKKFICNHNMIFIKNTLEEDLLEIINQAKNGICQLQARLQSSQTHSEKHMLESPNKSSKKIISYNQSAKVIGSQSLNVPGGMFKKKSTSIREPASGNNNNLGNVNKSSPFNSNSQKIVKNPKELSTKQIQLPKRYQGYERQKQRQNQPATVSVTVNKWPTQQRTRQTGQIIKAQKSPVHTNLSKRYQKQQFNPMVSQIKAPQPNNQYLNQLQLSAFDHDILSEVYQSPQQHPHEHQHENHHQNDNSLVSNISASQLIKQTQQIRKKGKYDKWDILFKLDQK